MAKRDREEGAGAGQGAGVGPSKASRRGGAGAATVPATPPEAHHFELAAHADCPGKVQRAHDRPSGADQNIKFVPVMPRTLLGCCAPRASPVRPVERSSPRARLCTSCFSQDPSGRPATALEGSMRSLPISKAVLQELFPEVRGTGCALRGPPDPVGRSTGCCWQRGGLRRMS